jgi:hypothetical protein
MRREARGEEWLESALRELADADAQVQAPAHVGQSLRAAFRSHARRPERRTRGLFWLAAAAAVLAAWTVVQQRVPDATVQTTESDEESFLPLVEGDPLAGLDAVQVVRVRLPGSVLARLGGPATASDEPVDAQVILGQDGIARAIRFVE